MPGTEKGEAPGRNTILRDLTITRRLIALRGKEKTLDNRYLLYCLLSAHVQRNLLNRARGSTVPRVLKEDIFGLDIPVPPYPEQLRIAELLGSLDDKIELNRQTARTLEQLAQRLFKSWFVDFDPVRAKMEGRQPAHMDADTAGLFPDRLEESGVGQIPKGWGVVPFSEQFAFTMGQSPPGDTYNEAGEGKPFFQGKTDFGAHFPTERVYCSKPTRFARAGDTLFSVRAPVGAINIALTDCAIGRGLCAIRHKSDSVAVTYHWIWHIADHIENLSGEGALFRSLSKKQLQSVPVINPPDSLLAAFDDVATPIMERLEMLECETRTLERLRDMLLPKLISGELRIPEAERQVEQVV